MKTIIFNNPPQNLFFRLKELGLVNFYEKEDTNSHHLKGKTIFENSIKGISEKACWGDNSVYPKSINLENFSQEENIWLIATINLSDKGIEVLKQSDIKNWKVK